MGENRRNSKRILKFALLIAGLVSLVACSNTGGNEAWREKNAPIVAKLNLKLRERSIPETDVPPSKFEPGKVYARSAIQPITIAPGVTAKLIWNRGALLEILEMEKGATYPEQHLNEEVITAVQAGSASAMVDGKSLDLGSDSVLYLTPGSTRSLKAGPDGLKALEVFSPVRVDLLALAGVNLPANAKVSFPDQGVKPSIQPGTVYRLSEIQLTPVTTPDPALSYKRAAANSRLIWGKNAMLSFIRMDPNSSFPMHIHPEDQMMTTLRGSLKQTVMDTPNTMTGAENSFVIMPGGMTHGASMSEFGGDALDIFWPVRPDYASWAEKQNALYQQVIPADAKPTKVADGFTFTEGATWLKGKLYFSDMYFKDPDKGDWTGSPARSRLIAMDPDGKSKVIYHGKQTNGTIATKDANLMVCDMFGHRVFILDPNTGKELRTVLDKINGKPIDGPNDLVMDAKGGVYVSDPQFTADTKKSQPGKQVYYIAPDGSARVVIPAGEYAMPNGVEISPDGTTFYVNNTWLQPGEDYLYAYDIQPDGSLTNKRKFAKYNLIDSVLSAPDPVNRFDSRADGSTVDMDGRIYQATLMGVQIWDKTGVYVGNIWFPQYPVSVTFGGKNGDVLYIVGEKQVWSIPTKVKGFRLPEGLN
jgi:gluconolactonase